VQLRRLELESFCPRDLHNELTIALKNQRQYLPGEAFE
jgi:hypothetical protein